MQPAKLRKASNYLYYEYSMFVDLSLYLIEDVHDKYFIENALIESFAIHLRNILDFLYSDSARKDDIIAEHFFTDPHIWRNARPQKSAKLDAMHHRVHKEIAHLIPTAIDCDVR